MDQSKAQNQKNMQGRKEGCSFPLGAICVRVNGKHKLQKHSQCDEGCKPQLGGAQLEPWQQS